LRLNQFRDGIFMVSLSFNASGLFYGFVAKTTSKITKEHLD